MFTFNYYMKNVLIALSCLVIFAGCKKSDSTPSIAGKWYAKKMDIVVLNYGGSTTITRTIDAGESDFLQLNNNGTAERHIFLGLSTEPEITDTDLTYTVSDEKLHLMDSKGNEVGLAGISSLTKNTLTLMGTIAVGPDWIVSKIDYTK